MKNRCIVFCLMTMLILGAPLFGQTEESPADKVSVELAFNASALEVTITDDASVDSFADSNVEDSTLGFSYEDELWGGSVSFALSSEWLRFVNGEVGEMFAEPALSIDELYGWVKPFGSVVKFTGGIFENTDGIADYTDDIDEYGMGVFISSADEEEAFSEPESEYLGPALTNGFLTDLAIGPVTLQLLFAPNFSGESATGLVNDLLGASVDTDERFFRLGGRVIVDAGVGTFAAVFKAHQWPMTIINAVGQMEDPPAEFPGTKVTYTTFGGYFDLTAVENFGLSVGYTGFLPLNDDKDVGSLLYSGIDLRLTYSGIEGLSLSSHNNISFASLAQGTKGDWMGLINDGGTFFTLYNAIGATTELTDRFSLNTVLSNIYTRFDTDADTKNEQNSFGVGAKFIVNIAEDVEFNAGAKFNMTLSSIDGASETVNTFSIPVGISLKF